MIRDKLIEILRKHLPEADADALIEHQFDAVVAFADAIIDECAKVCDDLWREEADAASNGTNEPKYHDCIECGYAIRKLKEPK